MWGDTRKHSNETAGSPGVEVDLSACTAVPSGDPLAQTGAIQITSNISLGLSLREVYDELQVVFHCVGVGTTMDVRPHVYIPDFKLNVTTGLGTWKALRLLEDIPPDAATTADVGTIFRIPIPCCSTFLYLQRDAVVGVPTATEAAVYGTEEIR